MYDENGAPIGIKYREESYDKDVFDCYLFEKNFQGDITGIFNEAGTQVVWYEYDAWGNQVYGAWVVHADNIYKNLFYANPFRYRGYYQDSETGFYYCGSRYYDAVTGRFINADSTNTLMNTPMAYTDKNLYAYCDNNPVMRVDNGGEFWDTVIDVVSLCFSVVDVAMHPDDPWAWVGLAADVVSLAVPFATGGGAIVKVFTKADDVVDFFKVIDNTTEVVDTATDIANQQRKLDAIETAANALDDGDNFVYYAFHGDGTLEYVGITNDFDRRKNEHKAIRTIEHYIDGKSRDAASVIEQTLIESFGRAGKDPGGVLSNIRNSISRKNPLYQQVIDFKNKLGW